MSPLPRLFRLVSFIISALAGSPTFAHDAFQLTTTGTISVDEISFKVAMRHSTGAILVKTDMPEPTAFQPDDFPKLKPLLEKTARSFFQITQKGIPLPLYSVTVSLPSANEIEFLLTYPRPAPGELGLKASFLEQLPTGFNNAVVMVTNDIPAEVLAFELLTKEKSTLTINIPPIEKAVVAVAPHLPQSRSEAAGTPRFGQFLLLGIEHILKGYDHLLFLAGLLVAARGVRPMLGIITSFTIAHSITLALAALSVVTLSSRLVEPLIALSIIFVGVENLMRPDNIRGRWLVTFAFGLIHGFGFASVLQELGLGARGSSIVVPLLGFNLGVEFGQLVVAGILLAFFFVLQRIHKDFRYTMKWTSAAIIIAGLYWFTERTLFV